MGARIRGLSQWDIAVVLGYWRISRMSHYHHRDVEPKVLVGSRLFKFVSADNWRSRTGEDRKVVFETFADKGKQVHVVERR
jgi:hypothetical protein